MRGTALFAGIALVPALCGPVGARAQSLEVALCQGGSVEIPLRDTPAPLAAEPCCAKGCHSQRKRPLAPASD